MITISKLQGLVDELDMFSNEKDVLTIRVHCNEKIQQELEEQLPSFDIEYNNELGCYEITADMRGEKDDEAYSTYTCPQCGSGVVENIPKSRESKDKYRCEVCGYTWYE